MQATTALLLGLSYRSYNSGVQPQTQSQEQSQSKPSDPLTPGTPSSGPGVVYPLLLDADLGTAIASAKKAMLWIHATSQVDMASRKAFVLCENVVKRIAPGLGIDLSDWPDGSGFVVDFREGRRRGSSGTWNGSGASDGDANGNLANSRTSNGSGSGSGMESFEELVDFEGGVF